MADNCEINLIIIKNLVDEIKETVHNNLTTNSNINKEINDKLMRMCEETDDDSSKCSSATTSSSSSSSDDDENYKSKPPIKSKSHISLKSDDSDDEDDEETDRKTKTQKYLKTKDELTLDDLEPIEKLNLCAEEDVELFKMGQVTAIVDDKLVIIKSLTEPQINNTNKNNKSESNVVPLDEETILFDANRKALGKIFEVFGPVASPYYSIRFNNSKEIAENNLAVSVNSFIYYAPGSQKYTKFIFNIDEIRRIKGSDASWNHDNEPPPEFLEYSDDEAEQLAKRELTKKKKAAFSKSKNLDKEDGEEDSDEEPQITSPNKIQRNFRKNLSKNPHNLNQQHHNNQYQPAKQQQQHSWQNRGNFHHQATVFGPASQMPPMPPPFQSPYYPMYGQFNPAMFNPYFQGFQQPFFNNPHQYSNTFQPNQALPPPPSLPQLPTHDKNTTIVDKRFIQNSNMIKKSF